MKKHTSRDGSTWSIGQEVNTTHGKGVIVNFMVMHFNGLGFRDTAVIDCNGSAIFMPLKP